MTDYAWLDVLQDVADLVYYNDWSFGVKEDSDGPYLQISFLADGEVQLCRKWRVYRSMNASEFVRTCWMAVLAAEEHEARESFRYRGVRVMTPHVDFDKIAARGGLPVAATEDPR